ncbi:MAG TPA: HAMP domain-containing sensor histidine kinase, partial [Bacteroidia bacterium]|nr:HAMP domain-containing sensor histidine kinase [Bacteroidia bacterium]
KRNVELWAEAVRRKALMMGAANQLYAKIAREERKKVELLARANRLFPTVSMTQDSVFDFVFQVIKDNETVPVIITNGKGKILQWRNLDTALVRDSTWLNGQLREMRAQHDSVFYVDDGRGAKYYLYYKNSEIFEEIRRSYEDNERSFIREVASNPASAPAVFTDSSSKEIIAFGNLDPDKLRMDSARYMQQMLKKLMSEGDTILVSISPGRKNIIYYMESPQLQALRYFPVAQFIVIGMFLVVAYLLFSTSRRAEQNNVWIGMAKETAHQLGTPLSSILAWLEYLKIKGVDDAMTKAISEDVKRLEMITERFSKIGSQPKLVAENLTDALTTSIDYIRSRSPKSVEFSTRVSGDVIVPLNVPLFAWVIENICRNAVDAMDGIGKITIEVSDLQQFVYVDITDTGKGIPRSKHKTIFEPGFTTKQRGWGLGLSLTKRIIEQYHKGKIFVKRSEPGKGTTFRIVLNK